MKLKVLFFSTLREIAGCDEMMLTVDRDGPARVSDVLVMLYEQMPGLADWDTQVLLALDEAYVDRGAEVNDTQELAIMPPVQGG